MNDKDTQQVEKALETADEALYWLGIASQSLDNIRKWALVDLIGGGAGISFIKQRKIKNFQKDLATAKRKIKILEKNLKKIEKIAHLKFTMGSTLKFFDIFTRSALADLIVIDRLNQARDSIDQARVQISNIKKDLDLILE